MQRMWTPWRLEYIMGNKSGQKPAGCIFCDMLATPDDRSQLILHRGALAFLVLNKYPYNNGHLMAVPYRHADTLEALTVDEMTEVMQLAALAIRALRHATRPEGFNVGVNIGKVAGAGVKDHVHCHVVPRWNGDTNFMPVLGEVRLIPQELGDTYDQLRAALEAVLAVPDQPE